MLEEMSIRFTAMFGKGIVCGNRRCSPERKISSLDVHLNHDS